MKKLKVDFCSVRAIYVLRTGPQDLLRHDLLNQNLRKQKRFPIKQTEMEFSSYLLARYFDGQQKSKGFNGRVSICSFLFWNFSPNSKHFFVRSFREVIFGLKFPF